MSKVFVLDTEKRPINPIIQDKQDNYCETKKQQYLDVSRSQLFSKNHARILPSHL